MKLLQRHGTLTEAQLKRVLLPVVEGLRQVHAAGFLHRDIEPANIFVRRSDESPVLLDFGSARQALGRRSRSMTAIASAGHSPPEQYESDGEQGAWTDIYALSSLCYRAITGEPPMEATRRQSQMLRTQTDPLSKLAEVDREGYSPAFLEAVDWGLRLIETERPQSLDEWLSRLEGTATSRSKRANQSVRPPTAHRKARFDDRKYAGFWIRTVAAIIDSLLVTIVTAPILIPIYGVRYYTELFDPDAPVFKGPADFVVSVVLPAVIAILFWIHRQATPGKMAVSVRIVDARTGENPTTAQCVGRYFAYIPSFLVLGIGVIWVAFDKRKQGWHDKLAGTVVIRQVVPRDS